MGKKILIVDDESDVVLYLATLLREHGFDVVQAFDGVEGIQRAKEVLPDLICLDIEMPGKSGILMYEELRGDPFLKNTPVVVITGYKKDDPILKEFHDHLEARGISWPEHYVEKPFDKEALPTKIRELLEAVPHEGGPTARRQENAQK